MRLHREVAAFIELAFASALLGSPDAVASGDAARGVGAFGQCAACHSIVPGEQMTGPSLAHVWQRKAGTDEGFHRYSDAMKHADVVWNDATLDKWLTNPEAFIPGTTMTFPGVHDSKAREDVIAYLKAVAEGNAPKSAPGMGGMMNMQSSHPNLKSAPPEGEVTAIKHCADTYTVSTADGKTTKVWQFKESCS